MTTSGRVLVVDDDPVFRMFAELSLQRSGFEVVTRADGSAARDCLVEFGAPAFNCLVTDYQMPGIDGVSLMEWCREQDPTLSAILVTAMGEKRLSEQVMRSRAFDLLEKPVEIATLQRVVAEAAALTVQQRGAVRLRHGAEAAGRLQKAMMPNPQRGNDVAVECCFHPKSQAGGDFIVHQKVDAAHDVVLVTDVAGHDLAAAYVSSGFTGFARGLLEEGVPLDRVLQRYNSYLLQNRLIENGVMSVAVSALVFNHDLRSMTAYSCGAPPAAWLGAAGWLNTIGDSRSSPLGWFDELTLPAAGAPVPEGPIWLWTDGLEDLAASLNASTFSVAHALFDARDTGVDPPWLTTAGDDVLLARVWPAGRPVEQPLPAEPIVSDTYPRAEAASIDLLQRRWERSLGLAFPELNARTRYEVVLCAREAVLNSLQHGCGPSQRVAFQLNYLAADRALRLQVADLGSGHNFDPRQNTGTLGLPDLHRGLTLIHSLAAKTAVARNGAELILDFPMT